MGPDYDEMAQILTEHLRGAGCGPEASARVAGEALEALGVPALLEAVAVSEEIIRFGDGFHPIARFFADGSPEQAYILGVLRRGR